MNEIFTILLKPEEKQTLIDALRARLTYLQGIHQRQQNYRATEKRNAKLDTIEKEMLRMEGILYQFIGKTGATPKRELLKTGYENIDQSFIAGQRRRKPNQP